MFSMASNYTRLNNSCNTQMNNNLRTFNTCAYSPQMDIASRLDQAMKKAGYKTQQAIADASGVPQPTIARILKGIGKKGPESETIKKLANACGVSFTWLLEGKDNGDYTRPIIITPAIKQQVLDYEKLSLSYISISELELLTLYRQCTTESRELILHTAERAPKDKKRLKHSIKSV